MQKKEIVENVEDELLEINIEEAKKTWMININ